jgi:transposase InsO family protein
VDPVPADVLYENQSTTSSSSPEILSPSIRMRKLYKDLQSTSPPRMDSLENVRVLVQHKIGKIAPSKRPAQILDTGATVCGAGENTTLQNLRPCQGVNVQGAFGKGFQPTEKGTLLDMQLECLVIPGMTDTLISISAACKKGHTFIFDAQGCHGYTTESVHTAATRMKVSGVEVIRGELRNGLYHMVPVPSTLMAIQSTPVVVSPPVLCPPPAVHHVKYTNAQPASKYEHIHHSLGHPGEAGMQWHRKNTPGAEYTAEDASKPRGLCNGCLQGGMRQASTDHLRQHRTPPTRPGQSFSMDAFTCTTRSRNGNLYCDVLLDHFSRRHYCIFTKNRSAQELCEKATILFDLHPEWTSTKTSRSISFDSEEREPSSNFIRLDAESNYTSTEFLHWASQQGFRLERVPPRDKHANGAAERAVGVLTLTTNVIMLTPTPPVPLCFWDLAMEYAADTLSFCYSKAIKTSPYVLLHKAPVPFKFLQPFWTSCYVYFGQKN